MEYVLLEKQNLMPPEYQLHQLPAWSELERIIAPLAGKVAFDFETSGLDIMKPEEFVRTVSLANDNGCVAIDLLPETIESFCRWCNDQQLIAHNYIFDGSWLAKYTGTVIAPYRDTRGMFMDLANEGAAGQRWSLDALIETVLGWPINEKGLIKDYFSRGLGIMDIPWEDLGRYNALDSAATWQGYKYFESVIDKFGFTGLRSYQEAEYRNSAALVIEQFINGIPVDRTHLLNYARILKESLDDKENEFFNLPEIVPHAKQYTEELIESWNVPKKVKQDGTPAKNYLKYLAKVEKARSENQMNINSPKQMQWIFYTQLEYDPVKWTATGQPSTDKEALPYLGEGGKVKGEWKKIHTEYNNYVLPLIEYSEDGSLHPPVKVPATVTGRLGAGSSE